MAKMIVLQAAGATAQHIARSADPDELARMRVS